MSKLDPELVRWNLHLLLGDRQDPNIESCNETDGVKRGAEGSINVDRKATVNMIENDEIIAQALQEEFSEVAKAEASGTFLDGEQIFHKAVLSQSWSCPIPELSSETTSNNRKSSEEGTESSGSCSSPREKLHADGPQTLGLAEESALDGEVVKRLNHMVPTRHVPRVNGEIPPVDKATSDHERLLQRLELYDLVELKVEGDGNCQFRALSDQFYRKTEHHKFVRWKVVEQLTLHREMYDGYVPMDYDDYLEKMSRIGEWGDHVTLQAAADSYGVKIFILTSFKDTCYIEIIPAVEKSKRVIFLSFWAEVHYNSIYPEGEFPGKELSRSDFI